MHIVRRAGRAGELTRKLASVMQTGACVVLGAGGGWQPGFDVRNDKSSAGMGIGLRVARNLLWGWGPRPGPPAARATPRPNPRRAGVDCKCLLLLRKLRPQASLSCFRRAKGLLEQGLVALLQRSYRRLHVLLHRSGPRSCAATL